MSDLTQISLLSMEELENIIRSPYLVEAGLLIKCGDSCIRYVQQATTEESAKQIFAIIEGLAKCSKTHIRLNSSRVIFSKCISACNCLLTKKLISEDQSSDIIDTIQKQSFVWDKEVYNMCTNARLSMNTAGALEAISAQQQSQQQQSQQPQI